VPATDSSSIAPATRDPQGPDGGDGDRDRGRERERERDRDRDGDRDRDRAARPGSGAFAPPLASQAIGVFDSGVGGLTVARAVLARLPGERLVYLGDTARVPYGMRSAQTVLRYSRNAARFLLHNTVKLVLIACNTASAAALTELRAELPVGVLGAVEPGAAAAAAATRSAVVGVIGTLATVRSGAYERALLAQNPALKVHTAACPLLVPLIEEGWTADHDPVSELVVRRYLTELRQRAPALDTLVLGCTHYPLLAPLLQRVADELWGHPIALVDSAQAMAEAAAAELAARLLLAGDPSSDPPRRRATDRLRCFVTDEARVAEVGARFLGRDLGPIELVDLVDTGAHGTS
jgi:glutamate racemase